MSSWVLDASAVLAGIFREPGADQVLEAPLDGAVMSSVNLSEVIAKLAETGRPETEIRAQVGSLRLEIVDFDTDLAYRTGLLRPLTRSAGLSMGDRACLALAQRANIPTLTADRTWAGLDIGITVRVIR